MKDSILLRVVGTVFLSVLTVAAIILLYFYFALSGNFPDAGPVLSWAVVVAALASLIIPLGPIWFIKKDLILPLKNLITFSHQVAQGEIRTSLDGRYICELADLKESLLVMVGDIRKNLGYAEGILDCLSSSFTYLTLDTEGRITHISQQLLDLLDIDTTPEKCVGQTPGNVFFGKDTRSTTSSEVLRSRKKIEREADITTRKGNRRVFVSTALPINDLDNNLLGSFTLYFDLTQVRLQEEEIRQKNRCITELAQQSLSIADEVNSSSVDLSDKIIQADEQTRIQKDRITESATAMEEMTATVLEVARSSQGAAQQAESASDRSREGSTAVESLVSDIKDVDRIILDLGDHVSGLASQAEDIGKVISVINDIADQTNLLALNAAIEAARAGEAGRGFAVVADEVRKLAEKTMAATKEVADVIQSIQESSKGADAEMQKATSNVREVTEQASQSGEMLREILGLVEGTSHQIQSIASATEEQSAASEEINRAMVEVDSIASETLNAMEFIRESIERLTERSTELSRLINNIQDMDTACSTK